jgi:hypothetical protein
MMLATGFSVPGNTAEFDGGVGAGGAASLEEQPARRTRMAAPMADNRMTGIDMAIASL